MTTGSVLDGATPEHWRTVEANTGLVWRHVNRMSLVESSRDDAYQDGLLGLLRAAMLFDPARGYTFSTYADAWIRSYIQKGRGRLEGANFRHAVERGHGEYVAPVSLDAELSRDGSSGLADALVGDQGVEVDELAVDRFCEDDIERAIVQHWQDGDSRFDVRIGHRFGVHRQTVQKRRQRLRDELRAALIEDAA